MKINFFSSNPVWDDWVNSNFSAGDSLSWMYALFAVTGIFSTIFASAMMMYKKRIPMKEFMNSIYIMLPAALVGGSIFGKLGTNITWYRIFFFWEPGLSIFTALLFGAFSGYLWFSKVKHHHHISIWVYADCIIPNILIGQAIGRWGNLFNHEILGKPIDINKFQWLPDFIWQRLFYYYDSGTGAVVKELVYRQPLFLYESMATLTCWLLIVFLVPALFKLISKKPWKLDPQAFPLRANPLEFSQIKALKTYVEITYYRKKISGENDKINSELLYLTRKNAWKKAFFVYEVDEKITQDLQNQINLHNEVRLKALKKYQAEKIKRIEKINNKKYLLKNKKITSSDFKKYKKEVVMEFLQNTKQDKRDKSYFKNLFGADSRELTKVNNPYELTVLRCGTTTGLYIMAYALIRSVLDSFRYAFELPLKNEPVLNHLMLAIIFAFGACLFIFAQFISPYKWREEGWLYEKSY